MSDIVMVIRTRGLPYDDRLRKECQSMRDGGCHVQIVGLFDENEKRRGTTEYGIEYYATSLFTRRVLPHKRFLTLKTFEMWCRMVPLILRKRGSVLWIHNLELMGIVAIAASLTKFGYFKAIYWDQHELPPDSVLRNRIAMTVLGVIMRGCDKIVVANEERRDLLIRKLGSTLHDKIVVLNNYADDCDYNLNASELPADFCKWSKGEPYLVAQGGAAPHRHFASLLRAIGSIENMRLVVIGPYHKDLVERICEAHNLTLQDRLYFTSLIPQAEIANYVQRALASVVLYEKLDLNHNLCAPNRLYQAISLGVPVVVGDNEPMASLVRETGAGVVLNSDGATTSDLILAIKKVAANNHHYRSRARAARSSVVWNRQLDVLSSLAMTNY